MRSLRSLLCGLVVLAAATVPASADVVQDCKQGNPDQRIAACSQILAKTPANSKQAAVAYANRGIAYRNKGEPDKAIADFGKAIQIDPKQAGTYNSRGLAFELKGELDSAIADYTKAIELDPKLAFAYSNRGQVYGRKGERGKAIADFNTAIELDPKFAAAYNNRGVAYGRQGDGDRAMADYSKAIEFDPKHSQAYINRARIHEGRNNRAAALADYRAVIALPSVSAKDRERHDIAREREARLTAQPQPGSAAKPVQRVALVIGNSRYAHAGVLANPGNDARAVAASLKRLGFVVSEHYDATREVMGRALRDFGDRVEGAEWAVVYFAGHGIEINGSAYLVPTDAELKRDTHITDEAVSLSQIQAKVDAASRLGLVILDSCRNNPFVTRMVRAAGASRSLVGRGLAPVEPEGNVLVAYAAKHGTTAEDGSGVHSPYTEALLAHIEEAGLEINFLFRKVRDRVREKTAKRQEPFVYGSLGSEPLYFKLAKAQ